MSEFAAIGCIVEGQSEEESLPVLLRRIARDFDPNLHIHIPPPHRLQRTRLKRERELERAVLLVQRKVAPRGAVLVVFDSDDDCPAETAPNLLARAKSVCPSMPVAFILAKREFEAWFLAAAASLRGRRGLSDDVSDHPHPEEIRNAKGWLSEQMLRGQAYNETLDQPAFAEVFDIAAARRAESFDKLYREIVKILEYLKGISR